MNLSFIIDQTSIHPLLLCAIEYLIALGFLYAAIRLFGKIGVLVFIVLCIQIGNIQVLKATPIFDTSMALGTILFTLSYMATDLLADVYGRKMAYQGIWLGFFGTLMICVFMVMTLTYPSSHESFFNTNHLAMVQLFAPVPAILIASFAAYLISQSCDVLIFMRLKEKLLLNNLRLRFFISTALSVFLDNLIFSALAWHYLSYHPLPWSVILVTYIGGTYALRLVMTVVNLAFVQYFRNALRQCP